MNLPQPKPAFSPADYLEWEKSQETRNEYVAGEVFATSGASREHNLIAGERGSRV